MNDKIPDPWVAIAQALRENGKLHTEVERLQNIERILREELDASRAEIDRLKEAGTRGMIQP